MKKHNRFKINNKYLIEKKINLQQYENFLHFLYEVLSQVNNQNQDTSNKKEIQISQTKN